MPEQKEPEMNIMDMTHDEILSAMKQGKIKPNSPEATAVNLFVKQCEDLLAALKEEENTNA